MNRIFHLIAVLSIIIFLGNKPYDYLSRLEIDWVEIPAGEFLFSSLNDTTIINYNYLISNSEVTNKQYLKFLNFALRKNKIKIRGNRVIGYYNGDEIYSKGIYTLLYFTDNPGSEDIFKYNGYKFSLIKDTLWQNHPVKFVTWFGASAFAEFFGLRLPTNLEWEKAARGLSSFPYPWGNSLRSECANYFNSNDPFDNGTTPVKFFDGQRNHDFKTENNSSIFGVYDMLGNVSEWTKSYSEIYPKFRIFRGGSWRNNASDFVVYLIGEGGPELATNYIGFRCVK